MVQASEIADHVSFENWLLERSLIDCILMAQRASCRIMPLFGGAMHEAWAVKLDLTVLTLVRANLMPGARYAALLDVPSGGLDRMFSVAAVNASAVFLSHHNGVSLPHDHLAMHASTAAEDAAMAASTWPTNSAAGLAASAAEHAQIYAADLWSQVRDDARQLEEGGDITQVPIWSGDPPGWFKTADGQMRAIWKEEGAGRWGFWQRWWDGVLSGKQVDWALQLSVALIPEDVWQRGPDAVAERIRGIEKEFLSARNESQAENLLHAALADYSFDALDQVMRMVPFGEDIRHLCDPARLAAFLDDAETMRDDIELFLNALSAEGHMQGAGVVRTYFTAVLSELGRAEDKGHLRVGRIVELGKILEGYALNETVAAEFGPLVDVLRSHVRSLLDLTRRHFAATLTRMAPLRDISSSPDDDQWALLQDIQRGIRSMSERSSSGQPTLAKDDQSVLLSMADSIEKLLREHDVVASPKAKSSLRREVDHGLALLAVSVALFKDRARAEQLGPGRAVDSVLTPYKRATGLLGLWQTITSAT